jgi:hypothetical protein
MKKPDFRRTVGSGFIVLWGSKRVSYLESLFNRLSGRKSSAEATIKASYTEFAAVAG